MKLKGLISITFVAILIVFGAIAGILLLDQNSTLFAKNRDGSIEIYYSNGLADADYRVVSRSVPLFKDEAGGESATRSDYTRVISINDAGFKNEGFSFAGWTINNKDAKEYVPGGLTRADDRTVYYTAKWQANKYYLTFEPDHVGFENKRPEKLLVTYGEPIFGLYDRELTGGSSDFLGWRTAQGGRGELVEEGSISYFNDNTKLWAWWEGNEDYSTQFLLNISNTGGSAGAETAGCGATDTHAGTIATRGEITITASPVRGWATANSWKLVNATYKSGYSKGDVRVIIPDGTGSVVVTVAFQKLKALNVVTHSRTLSNTIGPFNPESMTDLYEGDVINFYLHYNSPTKTGYDDFRSIGYAFEYAIINNQTYYPSDFINGVVSITLTTSLTCYFYYFH